MSLTPEQETKLRAALEGGLDYHVNPLPIPDALVAVVSEMLAEAWEQGYTSGHSNAMRKMSDEPNAPTTPNPYRSES